MIHNKPRVGGRLFLIIHQRTKQLYVLERWDMHVEEETQALKPVTVLIPLSILSKRLLLYFRDFIFKLSNF